MASTDSNGILRVDGTDSVEPLHPVFNALGQSVSDAFDANTRIWPVATIAARTTLYNRVGATASRPLFVWYSAGATGRQLMYTRGGNATSDWKYYSSSEDVAESRIWRVANVTGRTAIFNSVGPGTTASPVMVWRADAPVGQNLEYNVTSNNAVANWHSYSSSQDVPVRVVVPRNTAQTTAGNLYATYVNGVVTAWGTVTFPVSNPVASVTIGTLPASIPGPSPLFDNEIRPAIASSGTNQTLVGRFASKDLQIVNRLATGADRVYFWGQYYV